MVYSVIPILFLLGAAHGIFLAMALFLSKTGPRRANIYLGCYTLVFVCALFDYFLDTTGLVNSMVYARTLLWPKEFLYGIFIYFYTRELTEPGRYRLRNRQWLHFIPAVLHILVAWPLLFMPPDFQLQVLSDEAVSSQLAQVWSLLLGDIELVLTVIQITIYILLSLRLIVSHQQTLLTRYANLERINLMWLRNLLIGTLIVYLCWLADEFISLNDTIEYWLDAALGLSMVCLIYGMSILGLRQSEPVTHVRSASEGLAGSPAQNIRNRFQSDQSTAGESQSQQKKYRNSAISEDLSESLFNDLQQTMKSAKLYSDNTLSLPKLAETVGLPVNYLSQIINQQGQQNFFDYINCYRIEEVQQLMQSKPNASLLELAMEAGFNSKSAFYSAFRKYSGQTPSQFRKSLLKQ